MDPVLLPILIAVVQALRLCPALAARTWLLPFVSAAVGVLAVYAQAGFPADASLAWMGAVTGLAASGLFDAGKGTVDAIRASREDKRDTLT